MITTKENVIVYTIELDTEVVKNIRFESIELPELFKNEFEREGMTKEAERMDKGGFSYRVSKKNSYFTEYKVSITTRRKFI